MDKKTIKELRGELATCTQHDALLVRKKRLEEMLDAAERLAEVEAKCEGLKSLLRQGAGLLVGPDAIDEDLELGHDGNDWFGAAMYALDPSYGSDATKTYAEDLAQIDAALADDKEEGESDENND